jgi:hypothetical protein
MSIITVFLPLENGVSDTTGFSYYNVTALTNWTCGHWEFATGQASSVTYSVRIPDNVAVTPNASMVLDIFANDSTAGHTANFQTADGLVTTNLNIGALASTTPQTYTTTATAYGKVTLTFAVQSTAIAGDTLAARIATATTGTAPGSNMIVIPYLKIDTNG